MIHSSLKIKNLVGTSNLNEHNSEITSPGIERRKQRSTENNFSEPKGNTKTFKIPKAKNELVAIITTVYGMQNVNQILRFCSSNRMAVIQEVAKPIYLCFTTEKRKVLKKMISLSGKNARKMN